MRYLRLFENLDQSIISEIKKIIDENQYVSDKDVTEEKLVYSDKWIIYIAKGTLDHIKSHMAPSVELGDAPGSYYTQNWKKGVESVISKFEPEVGDKAPFRTAWTGKDAGIDVGFVTIGYDDKLKNDEMNGFKSYTYERPVRDTKVKETIILKEEEATKTNFLTVVGAKIGEVEGKGLITLWTTYPDFQDGKIDGKEIPMNRNEFKQNGFYFKCSKEFFDKVPSEQMSESKTLKYLKTFESFKVFESNDEEFTVTNETTVDELDTYLTEFVDGLYDYGTGQRIIDQINFITYNSLIAIGKSEAEAEDIADDFTKRMMDVDQSTTHNEYDEGKISGTVKYNSKDIFEFDCHDDYYAFSGSFNDLSELLNGIKELLKK
jgi:hypothetical protein